MKKYYINKEFKKYASTMACDIAENVVDLLNNGEYQHLIICVTEEVNRNLTYYDDMWKMLQIYCTPLDCDFDKAYDELLEEIYNLIEEVEE